MSVAGKGRKRPSRCGQDVVVCPGQQRVLAASGFDLEGLALLIQPTTFPPTCELKVIAAVLILLVGWLGGGLMKLH